MPQGQDDKEHVTSPRSTSSPRIPAARPQELAAESSIESSIAQPCSGDAEACHEDGEAGFEVVSHHRNGRASGQQAPQQRGGTSAVSCKPGRVLVVPRPAPVSAARSQTSATRVLEVPRPAPASAARRQTSATRVLTVPRPRTRSS